jgi:hypothetical protein
MITLSKVSKWYPNFQVLKHCSTEVAKGEAWSCAVRGALASRRSSNASMGSSRSRKAPSRSPPFPSATPRRLAEAARPHRHGVSALRAFASPRGAMTRSVRPTGGRFFIARIIRRRQPQIWIRFTARAIRTILPASRRTFAHAVGSGKLGARDQIRCATRCICSTDGYRFSTNSGGQAGKSAGSAQPNRSQDSGGPPTS